MYATESDSVHLRSFSSRFYTTNRRRRQIFPTEDNNTERKKNETHNEMKNATRLLQKDCDCLNERI